MDENAILRVLMAVRFPMDVEGIERLTDLPEDTIEQAIRVLMRAGYVERSDCGATCSVCPLRNTCGFRNKKMWVITQRGKEALARYRQFILSNQQEE